MPRKRDGIIHESLEELQELERQYRGKAEGARVTMLLQLKQRPELQIEEVAALVGYSISAVKRWLKTYRVEGLHALLEKGVGGRPDGAIDLGLNRLKHKLVAGDFRRLGEVEQWLEEYRHSHRPRRSAQQAGNGVVKRDDQLHERAGEQEVCNEDRRREIGLEYLAEFFSSLSREPDLRKWGESIRGALRKIFTDIDYITLMTNLRCDIFHPDKYRPIIAVVQNVRGGVNAVETMGMDTDVEEKDHPARMIRSLEESNFPFKDYRAPRHFVFYLHPSNTYIGVIALWRKRSKPPISKQTLAGIEQLRPMFVYLFADFVGRYQAAHPTQLVTDRITSMMREMFDLTTQEVRILTLQLIGMSYEEIGSALNITLNTVRSHIRSIYTKAGAHSVTDFYAKYFSLLIKSTDRNT